MWPEARAGDKKSSGKDRPALAVKTLVVQPERVGEDVIGTGTVRASESIDLHAENSGKIMTLNFVEGAPANMLARLGLRPELIPPGQEITAIGAPRHDNPDAWFLKVIVLPDGTRFNSLQSPNQQR